MSTVELYDRNSSIDGGSNRLLKRWAKNAATGAVIGGIFGLAGRSPSGLINGALIGASTGSVISLTSNESTNTESKFIIGLLLASAAGLCVGLLHKNDTKTPNGVLGKLISEVIPANPTVNIDGINLIPFGSVKKGIFRSYRELLTFIGISFLPFIYQRKN